MREEIGNPEKEVFLNIFITSLVRTQEKNNEVKPHHNFISFFIGSFQSKEYHIIMMLLNQQHEVQRSTFFHDLTDEATRIRSNSQATAQ